MSRLLNFLALAAYAQAHDGTPIHWTYNSAFVFDVSGFVAPNPPKPVMLWLRAGGDYNDNEYFAFQSGLIQWKTDKLGGQQDWCLEAAGADKGAVIQANYCDSNNDMQKWTLVGTNWGSRIQLKTVSNKCINVQNNEAKSGQPLQIWDCCDDERMSFKFGGGSNPSPSPAPAPSAKCPNVCYSQGFQDGDCSCSDHGSWAMWVCTHKGGQSQSKPWFCSQPGCHCNQMQESQTAVTSIKDSQSLPPGWTHIGPGQSLPGKGSGDCTGCKLPVQTVSDPKITFQDCVDWFDKDCPNDQWPGDSRQPKGCFKGTNALALDVGWAGKPSEGMCRAWVCPGTPGVNKWAQWDCYYKSSPAGNNTIIV